MACKLFSCAKTLAEPANLRAASAAFTKGLLVPIRIAGAIAVERRRVEAILAKIWRPSLLILAMVILYFRRKLRPQLYFDACAMWAPTWDRLGLLISQNAPAMLLGANTNRHWDWAAFMHTTILNRLRSLVLTALALLFTFAGAALCQDGSGTREIAGHRKFAPGVLKQIPSQLDVRDSFSLPMTLPGVKADQWQPETDATNQTLAGLSKQVILFRDVYQYDFAFTGLRQIRVPVVTETGTRNKNFWYLIYRVRDLGETLSYQEVKSQFEFGRPAHVLKKGEPLEDKDRLFLPRFTLEGWVLPPKKNEYEKVSYRDTVSPTAVRHIRMQEDPRMLLLDGVQMSKIKIPKVKADSDVGVWGVAVWEDVHPYIDYVSVYANGLTNAYRLKRSEDDSITLKRKTLQLNFWRPGDDIEEAKDRLTYGIPLVDDAGEQIRITRRYALPGPVLRAYQKDMDADRKVLIMEADAQVDMKEFKSALVPQLNKAKLPESVAQAFADAGISVDVRGGVDTLIEGKKWALKQGDKTIELVLEPQYWEPDFEGIRFIKSLDFMWIYR